MISTGSCVVPPSINGENTVKLPMTRQGTVREAGILSVRRLFMPRAGSHGEMYCEVSHERIVKGNWRPIACTQQQVSISEVRKRAVVEDSHDP